MVTKFFFSLCFFCSLPLFADEIPVSKGQTFVELEDKAMLPLLTPALKERKKSKLLLNNGLEVLIISDPSVEQSGAMLSVLAGSWYDPEKGPGLAHFLEHMLFLGTRSYPEEGAFQRFVAQHGGMHNAFTSGAYTSYFFSIDHQAFPEALRRFADFFKEPLFNSSGIERELQAIDQEFAKGLEDDDRREYYVMKELFNPNHPKSHFGAGNAATLRHIATEQMRRWFEQHYSADLMRLIVYSPQPLEELKQLVAEDFGSIASHPTPHLKESKKPLIGEEFGGRIAYIMPIKEIRRLSLAWEVPANTLKLVDSKPWEIAAALLGDEGENSLLALLKKEELAEGISSGMYYTDRNSGIYNLQIDLTDKGVANREEVLLKVFAAIAFYRSQPISKEYFEELKKIELLKYQYQKADSTFSTLMDEANSIVQEDLSTYPEKSELLIQYDPAAVQNFFSALTPQTALMAVTAPAKLTGLAFEKKEKEMGIPYTVHKLTDEELKKLQDPPRDERIQFPTVNSFTPENLKLIKISGSWPLLGPIPKGKLLANGDELTLFWAPDTTYLVPKVSWNFSILTPEGGSGSAYKAVKSELWVKALKEALNSYSYPAKVAGLEYSIDATPFGFRLTIEGYSDKAVKLLEAIIDKINGLEVTAEQFSLYKELLHRQYASSAKASPLSQAIELLRAALYLFYQTDSDKALALEQLEYGQFASFTKTFLKERFIRAFLYGNTSEEQAQEIGKTVLVKKIKGAPYLGGKELHQQVIVLPGKQELFYLEKNITAQGNSLVLTIEAPHIPIEELVVLKIAMQAIDAPFYGELRTVQQTGYIVGSDLRTIEGTAIANFIIQSASYTPRDLLLRCELFIENFLRQLESKYVSEKDFLELRNSLIQQLTVSQQTLSSMGTVLFELAFSYDGDFGRIERQIEALKELKYTTFLEKSRELLGERNSRRFAIGVIGAETGSTRPQYSPVSSVEEIKKASSYSSYKP